MIIIRLMGGLGNQLFQYAFGKQISSLNNVELKLDTTTGFKGDYYGRSYCLDQFSINAKFATQEEICKFLGPSRSTGNIYKNRIMLKLKRIITNDKLISLYQSARNIYSKRSKIVYETKAEYDPQIVENKYKEAYFKGYWQSEKYFAGVSDPLRKDYRIIRETPENAKAAQEEILKSNSCGIHLRRYQNVPFKGLDKAAIKIYEELGMDYYSRALEIMRSKLGNIQLFVFSDDINWAKEKIGPWQKTSFVQTGVDILDFRLFSLCKHQVIANSTYSWWAAWLNSNKNKVVIAPSRWFRHRYVDHGSLYPSSWNVI